MCDCSDCQARKLEMFGGLYGAELEEQVLVELSKASDLPSTNQVGGSHYKNFEIQPSEFIHKNNLGWCEGNVIKYVCRHQFKNGAEDVKKAIHYLKLILQWVYNEGA